MLICHVTGLATCAFEGCELTNNLWLCLICGSLGCGRQQFGGGGGNGHGVLHTETSGHAVAVKMGTIEPEGTAGELQVKLWTSLGLLLTSSYRYILLRL